MFVSILVSEVFAIEVTLSLLFPNPLFPPAASLPPLNCTFLDNFTSVLKSYYCIY